MLVDNLREAKVGHVKAPLVREHILSKTCRYVGEKAA